jgi:hypothetical protein
MCSDRINISGSNPRAILLASPFVRPSHIARRTAQTISTFHGA